MLEVTALFYLDFPAFKGVCVKLEIVNQNTKGEELMKSAMSRKIVALCALVAIGFALSACGEAKPPQPPPPPPPEYADKHMPDGYWGNPDIIAQGKAIFIGAENIDVNCESCHGKDGKPVKALSLIHI